MALKKKNAKTNKRYRYCLNVKMNRRYKISLFKNFGYNFGNFKIKI